jgi:hypothetical protein
VLDYFDHKVFSHEVGSMKPDRRIYDVAIAAAGKPPESLSLPTTVRKTSLLPQVWGFKLTIFAPSTNSSQRSKSVAWIRAASDILRAFL